MGFPTPPSMPRSDIRIMGYDPFIKAGLIENRFAWVLNLLCHESNDFTSILAPKCFVNMNFVLSLEEVYIDIFMKYPRIGNVDSGRKTFHLICIGREYHVLLGLKFWITCNKWWGYVWKRTMEIHHCPYHIISLVMYTCFLYNFHI